MGQVMGELRIQESVPQNSVRADPTHTCLTMTNLDEQVGTWLGPCAPESEYVVKRNDVVVAKFGGCPGNLTFAKGEGLSTSVTGECRALGPALTIPQWKTLVGIAATLILGPLMAYVAVRMMSHEDATTAPIRS